LPQAHHGSGQRATARARASAHATPAPTLQHGDGPPLGGAHSLCGAVASDQARAPLHAALLVRHAACRRLVAVDTLLLLLLLLLEGWELLRGLRGLLRCLRRRACGCNARHAARLTRQAGVARMVRGLRCGLRGGDHARARQTARAFSAGQQRQHHNPVCALAPVALPRRARAIPA
jgi:hypothetical protein